jgi:hypothetical protein
MEKGREYYELRFEAVQSFTEFSSTKQQDTVLDSMNSNVCSGD